MLNIFKRNKKSKNLLKNWDVNIDPSFKVVKNTDSIQYFNSDETKVIFFSELKVQKTNGISPATSELPLPKLQIIKDENGWQLKGGKGKEENVLICVISFRDKNDEKWATDLFESIKPKN